MLTPEIRGSSDRRVLALACAVSAVVALTACSSSAHGGSGGTATVGGSGGTSASADTSVLGPDNPAKGAPVLIGYVYDGKGVASDNSQEVVAAKAAVTYANQKLGGLGGRPIKLVTCETKGSPTTTCGDQFATQKVVAVVGAQPEEFPGLVTPLQKAGILQAVDNNQVTGPYDVSFANPSLGIGAPAAWAKAQGMNKVALIVPDSGPTLSEISAFAPMLYKKANASVKVIGVPLGSIADLTPQVQAAASSNPKLIHIIGPTAMCASAMKAVQTLGLQAKVSFLNRCQDKASAASIPGGWTGATVFSTVSLDPANHETKLYRGFLAKYLPGTTDSPDLQIGYQAMIAFVRGLNAGKVADFTSKGLGTAFRRMPSTPLPLGGGLTYQCNRKHVTFTPAACSTGAIVATADADGTLKDFKVLNDTYVY